MKVTTVRFGDDLWRLLEAEAAVSGVSVSQYIREAALARAVAAASVRGRGPFELLSGAVREAMFSESTGRRAEAERALATLVRLAAEETRAESRAVRAESAQSTRKADQAATRSGSMLEP